MAKITSKSSKISTNNVLSFKNNNFVQQKEKYKKFLITSCVLNIVLLAYSILTTIKGR